MRRSLLAFAAVVVCALFIPAGASAATLHPGDILVAGESGAGGSVVQVDLASGAQTLVASGGALQDPWGIAVAQDGRIFVADDISGVLSIDPATGAVTTVSSDPTFGPLGLAFAPDGRLVVSDYVAGKIIAVDPSTGARTPIASGGGIERPSHLAVTTTGQIYVADEHSIAMFRVDLATGAVTKLAAGDDLQSPYGVTLTAAGLPLLDDYDYFPPDELGAILAIDPTTGGRTPISSGGFFGDPIGLARSFNGPLVVAEQDEPSPSGAVITVDPTTGVQSRLATGGNLHSPDGVTVVPPLCFGRYATIIGGPTPDQLLGTAGPDVIASVNGKDRVNGLGGNDLICGGNGKDTLRGGPGRDRIRGEKGAYKLIGGKGKDVLKGGKGRTVLIPTLAERRSRGKPTCHYPVRPLCAA